MPKLRKRPFPEIQTQSWPPHTYHDHMETEEKIEHWWQALGADDSVKTSLEAEYSGSHGSLDENETTGVDQVFFEDDELSASTPNDRNGQTKARTGNGATSAVLSRESRLTPAARLKKKATANKSGRIDGCSRSAAQPRMRIRYLNTGKTNSASRTKELSAVAGPSFDLRAFALLKIIGLVLLSLVPNRTLRLILMVLICVGNFPDWLPKWTGLIALVLPLHWKARLEVTLFYGMVVWLWRLEWSPAWRRVSRWVLDA